MKATPNSPSHPPLLALRGVCKQFGGVRALQGVDFELAAGEIHALLGENGAGKSTLIKILGGIHQPDSGAIAFEGRPVKLRDVTDADRLGIRLIHQELSLAPNLTVAENLHLGREPRRFGLLDRGRMSADASALLRQLGLSAVGAVDTPVARLSVARQQMVEIARALAVRARVLVLDEPTASLSGSETSTLFEVLARLRRQGVGIVYISHRLEEIRRLADRITVLRDGRNIGTQSADSTDTATLIRWMVGRDCAESGNRPEWKPGAVALAVRNLWAPGVRGVSFDLHRGEVLGLAGLVGAGRSELARALFGIEPITSGSISVEGCDVNIRCPSDALSAGIVLVPEDRKREGLVMAATVAFNLTLPWTREWNRWCRPDRERRAAIVGRAVEQFGIRTTGPNLPVRNLSGGNQQKVVVAKWMERPPAVLILDEPTRGVDVGAREELFAILSRLVGSGMAVLLISSDLPEVMGLSHRLALYRDGRVIREMPSSRATAEEVMAALTRNE
ncbi:MAG: sugar ABC transporter ATP-binding protein [Verrucomicrobiae bacterium]|nr:sugar ABC transporter ATP-binding protein [Verrucomicrobiae bacterium]